MEKWNVTLIISLSCKCDLSFMQKAANRINLKIILKTNMAVSLQVCVAAMAAWRKRFQLLYGSVPAGGAVRLHGLSGRRAGGRVSISPFIR